MVFDCCRTNKPDEANEGGGKSDRVGCLMCDFSAPQPLCECLLLLDILGRIRYLWHVSDVRIIILRCAWLSQTDVGASREL